MGQRFLSEQRWQRVDVDAWRNYLVYVRQLCIISNILSVVLLRIFSISFYSLIPHVCIVYIPLFVYPSFQFSLHPMFSLFLFPLFFHSFIHFILVYLPHLPVSSPHLFHPCPLSKLWYLRKIPTVSPRHSWRSRVYFSCDFFFLYTVPTTLQNYHVIKEPALWWISLFTFPLMFEKTVSLLRDWPWMVMQPGVCREWARSSKEKVLIHLIFLLWIVSTY